MKKIIWVIGALFVTDVSTTCVEAIFRVQWILTHPDDLFQSSYVTPGFKPFYYLRIIVYNHRFAVKTAKTCADWTFGWRWQVNSFVKKVGRQATCHGIWCVLSLQLKRIMVMLFRFWGKKNFKLKSRGRYRDILIAFLFVKCKEKCKLIFSLNLDFFLGGHLRLLSDI